MINGVQMRSAAEAIRSQVIDSINKLEAPLGQKEELKATFLRFCEATDARALGCVASVREIALRKQA